jgi:hypothetical protein
LIKTDSLGDSLWTNTFDGVGGYSIKLTLDGGYIIAGRIAGIGLIKTDSLGDTLWTKSYGGVWSYYDNSVQQTLDEGYIIVGTNGFSVYLIKTDSLGNTLWTKTDYDTLGSNQGNSVQQTSDGGYIITGYTYGSGAGSADVYLIKTDSLGDSLWTRTYGGSSFDEGHSVRQSFDGGYIITGRTSSFGAGREDVYVIKTDSLGDTLWTRTYGEIHDDWGSSIQQTFDGGYIIAGFTGSWTSVYLIKTNESGMVGIEEESSRYKAPTSNIRLFQNQPNPFKLSTIFRYHIPSTNHIALSIYDLSGRLVEILVDEKQEPGVYRVLWDGKNQSSGIYFYRLKSGNISTTKKLILLR